jgi:hypothetical protein
MRKSQTFAKRIVEWELLIVNLRPHLGELPFLQDIVTEMESLITTAKTLDSQQEVARGVLQGAVQQRQGVERQGEALRRRVGAHLRGNYGFTSNDLVKFGLRPRKTGPRARAVKKPVTPPAAPAE